MYGIPLMRFKYFWSRAASRGSTAALAAAMKTRTFLKDTILIDEAGVLV